MNGAFEAKFRDPSLVDFGRSPAAGHEGEGRRLECLGGVLVDRPLVQSGLPPRGTPTAWSGSAATFHRDGRSAGRWELSTSLPEPWQVRVPLDSESTGRGIMLEVRPAPSGQVGIFLEQIPQWQWLFRATPPAARILSLFAHSGAATLALAAAGAEVVHVDASRQATAMARRNAEASGLGTAPIRWLCDDARAVVARELRRGAVYDGVVLDPPSWGHGPQGRSFAIDRDLVPLLADLASLLEARRQAGPILLTCHSPGWHHRRLHETLIEAFGVGGCESGPLACIDAAGRTLPLGHYARHCQE